MQPAPAGRRLPKRRRTAALSAAAPYVGAGRLARLVRAGRLRYAARARRRAVRPIFAVVAGRGGGLRHRADPALPDRRRTARRQAGRRSEEHTSELQSLMRISYAVFCLKKKKNN